MYTTINAESTDAVKTAVETLRAGGILIYPTETCYGVGVDATNQEAVHSLLEYKSRREGKPISIAVSDTDMASKYAELNESAENLYDNYLPGPLTVVSRSKGLVAEGIASEYGTIGIRIPDYRLILDIVTKLGNPITATSANVSYKKHPYSIKDLLADLPQKQKNMIDLIIDAGTLPRNDPSTVVDTTLNSMNIIRSGKIAFETPHKTIMQAHTTSPEETQNFGSMVMLRFIDELKKRPVIMALGGELGAGKTQFTKGVGKKLGITRTIKSPTFNLSLEYPYSLSEITGTLVHIDTWRLSDQNEMKHLSMEKHLKSGNVIMIEWADKFFDILPDIAKGSNSLILKVRFDHISKTERTISVEQISET